MTRTTFPEVPPGRDITDEAARAAALLVRDWYEQGEQGTIETDSIVTVVRWAIHRLASKAVEPRPEPSLWLMRDNHTFLKLPLHVDDAMKAIQADEWRYGMLCPGDFDRSIPSLHLSGEWNEQGVLRWLIDSVAAALAASAPQAVEPRLTDALRAIAKLDHGRPLDRRENHCARCSRLSYSISGGAEMSPSVLIAVLQKLPEGCTLEKNQVGNLAVIDAEGEYVGYINLRTGELNLLGTPSVGDRP